MTEQSKDKGTLTEEQKQIVREIAKQAKELGIDPRFAVALANLESSFRHIPADDKSSTAFGPFQVNKATAEANGVDYDEMKKSPELAIRAGLMNIVRHANNPDLGGDPIRIAAAHRYGENSEFAKTGDPKGIDPTLRDYLVNVTRHFPENTLPDTVMVKAETDSAQTQGDQSSGDESWQENITPVRDLSLPEQSAILGIAGHGAGVGLGLTKPILEIGYRGLRRILPGGESAGKQPVVPAEPAPISSEWKPTESLKKPEQYAEEQLTRAQQQRLSPADKTVTGREAQTGYTEATGQQAARRKFQESVAKRLGLDVNRPLAEFPELASTRSGVVVPQQTMDTIEAEGKAEIDRIKARAEMAKARAERVQQIGGEFQKMAQRGQTYKPPAPPPEPSPSIMERYLKSFPGRMGAFGFGAGAMIPYATEAYRAAKEKFGSQSNIPGLSAVGIPTAGGLASLKFPRLFGGATTALGLGYALTHPREVAEGLTYSDINPTGFIGMPEEFQAPFEPSRGGLPNR